MSNKILTVLSATSLMLLIACGSSPSGNAGVVAMPEVVATRLASLRVVGNYNNRGTTDRTDDTYNYTYSQAQETLTLRVGNNNTLILIINGVETILAREEADNNLWQIRDGTDTSIVDYTSFDTNNENNILDVIAGKDETIQGTYIRYNTGINNSGSVASNIDINSTFGFATVGIQTTAPVVANQTATATYIGRIDFRTRPNTVTTNDTLSRESYFGDLTMNVDFGANTVAGMGELAKQDEGADEEVVIGIATFESAPIIGNGFDGAFTLDSALRTDIGLTDNQKGNYSGNFFGTNADDLAGVMRLNGTNANGSVISIGGFRGDRQDSQ